jgi:IS30 family transposase
MQRLDQLVSPLLIKGQSLAHIYAKHEDEIDCSRRTLYKYIDRNVFSARNIDLPRKVKYKSRKKTPRTVINKEYCKGRTYNDFIKYLQTSPTSSVVEMDTVEGQKGGKVLLTLFFRSTRLMLIYLMDTKCSDCVKSVLDLLTNRLGLKNFKALFPIILTDRGSEFQVPKALEYNNAGKKRTSYITVIHSVRGKKV